MKVNKAFPGVLDRRYPVVQPDYSLLTVLYLLRMTDVQCVPLAPLTPKNARAVFGYSALSRMVETTPTQFERFLEGPCVKASSQLAAVDIDGDLDDLLKAFDSARFGFAVVHDGTKRRTSLVTLTDFLSLYSRGILRTSLSVTDVASKIASMPGSTPVREAVESMLSHRRRRIFLSGKSTFVSDRSIMHQLFNPMILEDLDRKRDSLSLPIEKIEQLSPGRVDPRAKLAEAAKLLLRRPSGCLTAGQGALVTPWDLVMKPWKEGALRWG